MSSGRKRWCRLSPPTSTAARGEGRRGDAGGRVGSRLRQPRRRQPMRRGRGHQHIVAAQPVVLGDPDQVGGAGAGARILQDHREAAAVRGLLHGAQIGDGAPARGDDDVGEGRADRAAVAVGRLARVDRPARHQPGEGLSRRDAPDLGRHAEPLGDAEALHLVAGLAVGQDPDGGRGCRARPVPSLGGCAGEPRPAGVCSGAACPCIASMRASTPARPSSGAFRAIETRRYRPAHPARASGRWAHDQCRAGEPRRHLAAALPAAGAGAGGGRADHRLPRPARREEARHRGRLLRLRPSGEPGRGRSRRCSRRGSATGAPCANAGRCRATSTSS